MMLTLIVGDAGSGKTTYLVNAILEDLKQGIPSFLIVPEQKTVTTERRMADLLPPSSCLTFEVTNFTRLCDTIFRCCGRLAGDVCDTVAEQLLMWRTMSELSPLLTSLHHRPDAASVMSMRATIRELHAHKLTPSLLKELAENLSDKTLADKVGDYALIWSTYDALVSEHYTDSQSRLDIATELLSIHKPFAGYHIYIDDFSSYTLQELDVMKALLETCDLMVTLCMPPNAQKQLCADEVLLTQDHLAQLASQKGCGFQKVDLGENKRALCPPLRFALEHLWRIDYASHSYTGEADDNLVLVETAEPTDACHYIAADILRRVQTEGARFSDFAIVCGNTASYAGVLDMVLERNHIPFFFSRPAETASLEPLKAIFAAYNIVCHGWQKEDVVAYLKCGMTGVTPSVCDELELYAETWDLQGKRWYDGASWTMGPDGYGTPFTKGRREYTEASLARMNEARNLFVAPLRDLASKTREECSVANHIGTLTEFLLAIHMPEQLEAKEKGKHNPMSQVYGQLWDTLCDALDTMHKLLSDVTMTAEDFASILKMLLSAKDLGHLPAHVDEVTIGQAALLRSESVKHVYLLGAVEGEFPGVAKDDGAFTEQERTILLDYDVITSDSLSIRAARELFSFRRAMALTEESLTILWSRATTTFDAVSPSDAVLRLRTLLGSGYPVIYLDEHLIPDLIWSYGAALERLGQCKGTEMGEALRAVLSETPVHRGAVEALATPICNSSQSLSPSVAQQLFPSDLALTQTRINAFLRCPFSYFCTHTLHLSEDKRGEFDALNIGIFVHALLERFFGLAREKGLDIHELDEATQESLLDAITQQAIEDVVPTQELQNPRTQYVVKSLIAKTRVILESMCDELSHSQFEPAFFEVKIEKTKHNEGAPAPVMFRAEDGSRVFVYGTIDRVDKLVIDGNAYVRVVDYKTGIATITQDSTREGETMQMPLYLFSLLGTNSAEFKSKLGIEADGTILPAGVMYLSSLTREKTADAAITTEEAAQGHSRKQVVRSGLFLYDERVLSAMDDTSDRSFIGVKKTKNKETGELEYNAKARKKLLTQEEFDTLLADMGQLLTDIAMRIKGGDATAAPMKESGQHSTCNSCPHKAICRHVSRPTEKSETEGDEG